jgi:signal peptidase I
VIKRHLARVPRPWRHVLDWLFTIVGAVAIVFAIKAWVVNPYRIPSASMETTLHCAQPASSCLSHFSDRILANRLIYRFRKPKRGEIAVFRVPEIAKVRCGSGGVFVKRIIGLPGEVLEEKRGYVYINGKKLDEPYIRPARRDAMNFHPLKIGRNRYFMMGDNRASSCDSRVWLTVPRENFIGEVVGIYWPPNRIRIL